MLADPNRDIGELWMEMTTYGHVDGQNHHAIGSAARDMMDRPEEEAGSVLSTAKSYLALYRDPVVARSVSRSDFRIKDLMHSDDPVSLYIVTQPNDKARLRPLVRVMVNMIVRLLADKMDFENGRPVAHYKHRLLMMLDEFPSLGKLEIMQESLAFVAGYGIKCYLICQDINQPKPRDGLRPRRKHHVELPRAERLSAQPRRDSRTPVPTDRADHRGEGADHDQRPPHGGDAGPGVAHLPGSAAPLADAR
jgi:type IV secretion system protein VirD4